MCLSLSKILLTVCIFFLVTTVAGRFELKSFSRSKTPSLNWYSFTYTLLLRLGTLSLNTDRISTSHCSEVRWRLKLYKIATRKSRFERVVILLYLRILLLDVKVSNDAFKNRLLIYFKSQNLFHI